MASKMCFRGFLITLLIASSLFAQTLQKERMAKLAKENTRLLMAATDYGTGGFAFHRIGRPSQTNVLFGIGALTASDLADQTINGAIYTQRGLLFPIRLGIRHEIFRQELPAIEWAFYWVSSAGPVLAFGFPQGLDFRTLLSRINVGLGGEIYTALGLEAFFGVGLALYLEGGVYAMNAFASRSLFRQANYFGPSFAFGMRFGI